MSVQVETLEKNMAKLTVEVEAAKVEEALQKSYLKNRGHIALQGFRKGHAPRQLIEKMYGPEVFYEDAANFLINDSYPKAAEESGLEIVSHPEIEVDHLKKGENFVYHATVALRPEVKLGQYRGLKVETETVYVTAEDVDAELKKVQEQNSRLVTVEDRAVEEGDIVNLDYAGSVDGVPFQGGTAEGQELTIGSHMFIPGFEEQMVGLKTGEEADLKVTFPEEYHAEELKGKDAVFHVKVNRIQKKELPELDDEFASDVSEFDTLDEYKKSISEDLREKREKEVTDKKENALVDLAVSNAEMEIPEPMIHETAHQLVNEFASRMRNQGLTMEMYLQYTGQTVEQMVEQVTPNAEKRIRTRLVLEEIAKAENLTVTDEEFEKEIENMASMYQMEKDQLMKSIGAEERAAIEKDLAVQKAVTLLVDSAE